MNEVSSFCEGSWYVFPFLSYFNFDICAPSGTGANLSNTAPPFILPGDPGGEITTFPEWYVVSNFLFLVTEPSG